MGSTVTLTGAYWDRLKEVLMHYDIGNVLEVRLLGGGTANRNFLIGTDRGPLVLRERSLKYSSENSAVYEQAFLNHVASRDIPGPRPRKTLENTGYVWAYGRLYEVFTYLDGDNFDPSSVEDLEHAGEFLGRLHVAVRDFKPPCEKALPRYDDPAVSLSILNSLEGNMGTAEKAGAWGRDLLYLRAQVMKVMTDLPDSRYHALPKLVIHGDFHPANLRFINHRVSALFDFDWVSLQPRVRDIADGLLYFAAEREAPIDGSNIYSLTQSCRIDPGRSLIFLKAYQEVAGELGLTECEVEAIPSFMRARWIYSRVQATQKVPEDERLGVLLVGVRPPLEWLDQNERDFIQELIMSI